MQHQTLQTKAFTEATDNGEETKNKMNKESNNRTNKIHTQGSKYLKSTITLKKTSCR